MHGTHNAEYRRAMIAKIHIAAREARLCHRCRKLCWGNRCISCNGKTKMPCESDYREFLKAVTGKGSCKHMGMDELERVLKVIGSRGYRFVKAKGVADSYRQSLIAVKRRLLIEAEHRLGTLWRQRLRGFCRAKLGVDDIAFVHDIKAIRQAFAFIRAAADR